jgi:hypothetical protein
MLVVNTPSSVPPGIYTHDQELGALIKELASRLIILAGFSTRLPPVHSMVGTETDIYRSNLDGGGGGGGPAGGDLWLAARKSAPSGVPNKGDL